MLMLTLKIIFNVSLVLQPIKVNFKRKKFLRKLLLIKEDQIVYLEEQNLIQEPFIIQSLLIIRNKMDFQSSMKV